MNRCIALPAELRRGRFESEHGVIGQVDARHEKLRDVLVVELDVHTDAVPVAGVARVLLRRRPTATEGVGGVERLRRLRVYVYPMLSVRVIGVISV